MSEKEYKTYQQLYDLLVEDHPDDFTKMEFVVKDEIVENALSYFKGQVFPLIYPAKSYAVAIIYATLIHREYGYPVVETLNDPDLFLGQDGYFVPYSADPENYDKLLERVKELGPHWFYQGWGIKTCEYWVLECTEKGVNQINEGATGIEHDELRRTLEGYARSQ